MKFINTMENRIDKFEVTHFLKKQIPLNKYLLSQRLVTLSRF